MLTITLIRNRQTGKAVTGLLSVPFSKVPFKEGEPDYTGDTLENADFLIPEGTYPLDITWSPKFRKDMPEIMNVPVTKGTFPGAPRVNQQSVCDGESGDSPSTFNNDRVVSSCTEGQFRAGIRIHRGTIPEHSTGCVLVNAMTLESVKAFINRIKKYIEDEEVFIDITSDFDGCNS